MATFTLNAQGNCSNGPSPSHEVSNNNTTTDTVLLRTNELDLYSPDHPRRILPHPLLPRQLPRHGVRAIDAIHTALNGNPWLPTISTA